jgi:hypothetical protein
MQYTLFGKRDAYIIVADKSLMRIQSNIQSNQVIADQESIARTESKHKHRKMELLPFSRIN